MKIDEIKNPVSTLQGVGPKTVKCLSNLNIFTVGDLLKFYPRDFEDKTARVPLNQFEVAKVHTIAKVLSHEYFGFGKMKTLKIIIQDETGRASLIAFNQQFLEKSIPVGSVICVSGIFKIRYNELQCSSFDISLIPNSVPKNFSITELKNIPLNDFGIFPIYSLTQGLSRKTLTKIISKAISEYAIGIDNDLPEELIKRHNLLSKKEALKKIHAPQNLLDIERAKKTLIYEELYFFQKTMLTRALEHKGALPSDDFDQSLKTLNEQISAQNNFQQNNENSKNEISTEKIKSDFSPLQAKLLESLPFSLTKDQLKVINQINEEIDKGYKERSATANTQNANASATPHAFTMQRLIQGDVGSGKTLVALFAALRIVNWGGQVAFMAPTEILSRQHAENFARYVEGFGVRTAFLTGNVKASGRKTLLRALQTGDVNIIIGTHALFSSDVIYKDLELAIIDEQHRFGVMQRQAIIEKGKQLFNKTYASPHLLMMSATPIPQTLALTVFGDLDVSTIKTLPQGRKEIKTYLVASGHEQNAYNAVRQELDKGHQAYFVYPAIDSENVFEDSEEEKNESENFQRGEYSSKNQNLNFQNQQKENIKSAVSAFENLSSTYFKNYKCALLHSKVPEVDQARILDDFRYGKIQMLFATTVVEVGVDVPNATCMVIEQADRFGLSQLHQLRGRVGRGKSQSYCFLIYRKNITENGIQRMKILYESTDGFEIAEEDLKLRGPGEIAGTIQSGELQLGLADLSRDKDLLLKARHDALEQLKKSI